MMAATELRRWTALIASVLIVFAGVRSASAADAQEYIVGVGIADVTGPAAEIGMMGYASASQIARGIHMRLFARAFIFQTDENATPVVYVSVDTAMIGQAVKLEVARELQAKFGSVYSSKNVLISATHTHSGPAGYMEYVLYGISSYGFVESNFRAIVDGIVESIEKAHKSRQPAKLYITHGEVENANINRSPSSYLANPPEERAQYAHDVDKDMWLVRIDARDGTPLGTINWFAVHPTSMNNTNRLISGDNKGYASQLFEEEMNGGVRPGLGKFVAAFGSSNLGDVSPNTRGPKCIDTWKDCDFETSTCPNAAGQNLTQNCIAFGPGENFNMKDSTRIIAETQFKKAKELFEMTTDRVNVHGNTGFAHQYINMSNYVVTIQDGATVYNVTTCPGALGYSFAAGTTDGPGAFDFTQGTVTGNPFWDLVRDLLRAPSKAQRECQAPKPILLDVGESFFPYEWVPSIVETQVIRIGNLYIIGMPGELTTMSGRRLRAAIRNVVSTDPDSDAVVVVAGLSNVYTHYITTFEEYQKQRYEAASTLYGPHTLQAYIQQFTRLTKAMLDGAVLDDGPAPPLLIKNQISLNPPIIFDAPPLLRKFGDCIREPYPVAFPGETISVTFVSGHPRNNPLRGGTFFLVERKPDNAGETDRWEVVATDANWSTEFRWSRPVPLLPNSEVDFKWEIPETATPGVYRIRHFGYYKPLLRSPLPYDGTTNTFQIKPKVMARLYKGSREDRPEAMMIRTVSDFWNALMRATRSARHFFM